jgi:HTH-type transcriptional repressor of NAD biosynthesis genes
MTALPPTKGHVGLIEYAAHLGNPVTVLLMTQPGEPLCDERHYALSERFEHDGSVTIHNLHKTLPQDPETPGFRDLWRQIMSDFGCTGPNNLVVASEPYGMWLAEITGATFVPYDPYREILPCKATDIREDPVNNFSMIAREFQKFLRINVTVFGAESTGKTTLTKSLALNLNGHFFMEWARPYLEMVGPDITVESMGAIWRGQRALEAHSDDFYDKPFAFFDTDLYSTIGYWEQPHWAAELGPVPQGLIEDAIPSDLYIITQANIPFEEDPLRYGGDHRESDDEYWIQVAETYGLNYVVLQSSVFHERLDEAQDALLPLVNEMRDKITYDRGGF